MRLAWLACFLLACASPSREDTRVGGSVAVRGIDGGVTADAFVPPLDAPSADPSLTITAPLDGARFVRDSVEAGFWIARVRIDVETTAIETIGLFAGTTELARAPASAAGFDHFADEDGELRLVVVGYDASGLERARDEVTITIDPPADTGCHAMLDALGIDWAPASATRGIADPVRVQPLIGGVRYRYVSNAEPTAMTMDCELAPRLHHLSRIVQRYGVDEVIHIGIYNYRCIGGAIPTAAPARRACTPKRAPLDIWGLGLAADDTEYVLERDWIITDGDTCPGTPSGEADRVLHEVGCAMWSERAFQIVLTPNYNAAHRNHFHVDMTPGSMFIGYSVAGVDPPVPGLGHTDVDGHTHDFDDDEH
ncbi:MAG: extensin family protein [Sandaracinus sp.]|nr:extensin family protein [Sandaracinus sp.]